MVFETSFRTYNERHALAQLKIFQLIRLPFRIGHKYGVFPLVLVPETLELHSCWKCLLTAIIPYLFMAASSCSFLLLSEAELKQVYKITGATEKSSNVAVHAITQIFDNICMLKLWFSRNKVQSFFVRFMTKIVSLLEIASAEKFYTKEIKNWKYQLNCQIVYILTVATISLGNNFIHYSTRAIHANLQSWKLLIIAVLSFEWVALNQIRMLTFQLWISMVICFKIGFTSLRIFTVPKLGTARDFLKHRKISWAMQEYRKLEVLLEEFHELFSLQFCNLCFTSLVNAVNAWFQLTKFLFTDTPIQISTNVTLACDLATIFMTLGALCNVCSEMTNEVCENNLNILI